jgi:hypothetical protein
MSTVRVLYIAGSVRSGSTVLERILDQVPGFFSGGELGQVWNRGLRENWLCGCGAPFRECATWRAILEEAFGDPDAVDSRQMFESLKAAIRIRRLPRVLLSSRTGLPAIPRQDVFAANLLSLYRAIATVTGASIIVDSSKLSGYGHVLGQIPGIELSAVHLVRDPRAVAFSRTREKAMPGVGASRPSRMPRSTPAKSALLWSMWNLAAEALRRPLQGRYLLLRYEDFVAAPRAAAQQVLALLGEESASLPFVTDSAVNLGAGHSVSGNTSRLQTGTLDIRPDREWASRMSVRDRAIVTALTWPLLIRYHYVGKNGAPAQPRVAARR